jgi:hypothetical protein
VLCAEKMPDPRRAAHLRELDQTWNATARPRTWTKTADQIIGRICRYCSRISGPGHQGRLNTRAPRTEQLCRYPSANTRRRPRYRTTTVSQLTQKNP